MHFVQLHENGVGIAKYYENYGKTQIMPLF